MSSDMRQSDVPGRVSTRRGRLSGRVHSWPLLRVLFVTLLGEMSPMTAQANDDPSSAPGLHELAEKSELIQAKADFRNFKFCPPGDKIVEQPENDRLLFKRPDGSPDGYAQRRGNAIIYYDRYGKVVRVQAIDS